MSHWFWCSRRFQVGGSRRATAAPVAFGEFSERLSRLPGRAHTHNSPGQDEEFAVFAVKRARLACWCYAATLSRLHGPSAPATLNRAAVRRQPLPLANRAPTPCHLHAAPARALGKLRRATCHVSSDLIVPESMSQACIQGSILLCTTGACSKKLFHVQQVGLPGPAPPSPPRSPPTPSFWGWHARRHLDLELPREGGTLLLRTCQSYQADESDNLCASDGGW